MSEVTRLIIVDDHQLFRECLTSVLTDSLTVVDSTGSAGEALKKLQEQRPDVAIIDLGLPDDGALGLTRQIKQDLPQIKVVIFGLAESETEILKCAEAGAAGYVSKEGSLEDLKRAIQLAIRGETACSPRMAHALFSRLAQLSHRRWRGESYELAKLTAREIEILRLVADGLSNKQIAEQLFLSLHTVKNHLHNILEKLQVDHRWQAVEYAYNKQWLQRRHIQDLNPTQSPRR